MNQKLCNLFDEETSDGTQMQTYNELLKKSVKGISSIFKKRVATGLQNGRNFVIPTKKEQADSDDDFELLTWFVLK